MPSPRLWKVSAKPTKAAVWSLIIVEEKNSIKGILRRRKFGVQQSSARAYIVDDITPIHDSKLFLANNEIKNSLTFYLANIVLQLKVPVVTVTRLHVKSNINAVQPLNGVSTQEETDTLIMLHTAEISKAGNNVHIMTQDTDVMVLALQRLTVLGLQTTMLMETGDNRRKILTKPIYVRLGTSKAAELPGFYCLTGCDTCGHIKGIGKKTAFKAFNEAAPVELTALNQLGVEEKPSADVVSGCERFFCWTQKRPTGQHSWKIEVEALSESTLVIDKILPSSTGARYQHNYTTGVYTCHSISLESRPCGKSKYSRPVQSRVVV